MFFYLSKILWFFAAPSNLLAVLAVVGALLCGTRFIRLGRRVALWSAGLLLFVGIAPIGSVLFYALEQRFPTLPREGLDPYGIVVLGGAMDEERTIDPISSCVPPVEREKSTSSHHGVHAGRCSSAGCTEKCKRPPSAVISRSSVLTVMFASPPSTKATLG